MFESTAEETNAISRWDKKGVCCPYSIQQSNQVSRFGSYSLRFEVNKTDEAVANGIRAEVNRFSSDVYPLERWLGFSIYIPNSSDFVTDQKFLSDIVSQWHDVASAGESELKNPFDLAIDADKWKITVRHAPMSNATNADIKEITTDIGTMTKGKWTDFVIHIKFTHLAAGILQIWMNGTQVHNYTGPMGYNHKVAPYLKTGIYKWPWNAENLACCGATNSKKHVIYIDEIRLGSEKATYQDVSPTVSSTLTGSISLQGRSAAPNNLLKVPLQVDLYKCPTSSLFASYNVTTDQTGQFSISGIHSGAYTIAVKNNQTLKKANPLQALTAGNNSINFGVLLSGDVNNDNVIDSLDIKVIANSNNKTLSDSSCDSRADLNGDSIVSKADLTLLLNNFQQAGQPVSCNCTLQNPMITASSCNGATAVLRLSAATGSGPYNLAINGAWYNNLNIGDTITTFSFAEYSVWPSNIVPLLPSNNDSISIEVGVKFASAKAGFVKGIRFYNGNNNSGTYIGRLYNYKTTSLIGSVTFMNVSKNGWQTVLFPTPVFIEANTTYIAACYSSAGNYAANNNYYFAASGVTNGPLTALKDGADGSNGLYHYGGGMPKNSHRSSNYWVDVKFSPNTDTLTLTNFTNADGCINSGTLQSIIVTSATCAQTGSRSVNSSQKNTIAPERSSSIFNDHIEPDNKKDFKLEQNYPNPFRNETIFKFTIPRSAKVNLSLFDMNGRLVKVLVNESKESGAHAISFNAGSLSSGLYYYKLQTADFSAVKKTTIQ